MIAEYRPQTNTYYYYMSDQINTTRIITDGNGNVVYSALHGPYGDVQKVWTSTYDPKLKFSGKEREGYSELDYFGARYYDHNSYRFISVDPIINKEEALSNPQLWNLYAYCRNNPITYLDPDGKVETNLIGPKIFIDDYLNSITHMTTTSDSGLTGTVCIDGKWYPRYRYIVLIAVRLARKQLDDIDIFLHEMDHVKGFKWLYSQNLKLLEESEKIPYSTREDAEKAGKELFKKGYPIPKKWKKYDRRNINWLDNFLGKHEKKWREWAKTGNFGDDK